MKNLFSTKGFKLRLVTHGEKNLRLPPHPHPRGSNHLDDFEQVITLKHGQKGALLVRPRWPSKLVKIAPQALDKLNVIQERLPPEITIILTRGYEPKGTTLDFFRQIFRCLGRFLFALMYPFRRNEIADIFGRNGHDVDGKHFDISFAVNLREVRLLPLGVLTPYCIQKNRLSTHHDSLTELHKHLKREGIGVHHNATERSQIHCFLRPTTKNISSE